MCLVVLIKVNQGLAGLIKVNQVISSFNKG